MLRETLLIKELGKLSKKKKKGGKITDSWIGTNADGDSFHAHYKKNREYKKIISIADLDMKDLHDWKESNASKKRKENKDG